VFLTAVAIADDLGAVAVIAIFHTQDLVWTALALGGLLVVVLAAINRAGVRHAAPYVLLGVALWVAVLKSGVHASVAGVLPAFAVSAARGPSSGGGHAGNTTPLLDRPEHALQRGSTSEWCTPLTAPGSVLSMVSSSRPRIGGGVGCGFRISTSTAVPQLEGR
jgi:NhaA family Na+:H+ antiporter